MSSHLSVLLCIIICCCCSSFGLGFTPHPIIQTATTRHYLSQEDDGIPGDSDKATASSTVNTDTSSASASTLFPVISKIAGVEFTGSCRYINSKLEHVTNLKLFGGVKYEIIGSTQQQEQQQQQQQQELQLKLSSFLTFPNGQTRQVVMQGERSSSSSNNDDSKDGNTNNVMTLHPVDNDGPIIMKISEIIPDTILINEVEKDSGRIIMTSSISLVQTSRGLELVGVSHEVGDDSNNNGSAETIEGHQIWRMRGPVVKEKVLNGEFQ